jgi:signal transduction histidine kinase/CheY-like chemotaxis protein
MNENLILEDNHYNILNNIINNIDESIIIVNLDNIIININKSAENIFKTTYEKIIGKSLNNLIPNLNSLNRLYTYKIVEDNLTKTYIIKKNQSNEKEDVNILDKECFLFNISHEIRTPLNGIIGISQILKDKLDENYQEYIDIISSCGCQLMDILNDILDYAKITSGNISLMPNNFNLLNCIEEIHNIVIPKANGKNLDINYTIDPSIPENIYCDQKRLKQILVNLLSNSVKFTESGFIQTNITLIKRSGIKIYLAFAVSDSGIGIPSTQLEKIFHPYVQINNKLSRKYEGTGLGLSISRQLAKLLNGDIKADSILGCGSIFTLTIEAIDPIYSTDHKSNSPTDFLEQNNYSIKTPPLPIFNNISCLVVDDNPNNRITLHQLLSSFGIKTILASSGEEALLVINSYTFDVIFIDICMPNIDGIKTCQEIRKCISEPHPPIIATSSIDGTIQDISQKLFDDMLIKPIKKKSLIRVLEKFIKNKSEK